ncbi:helix-turn-helix domain-containing protein [Mycolicibacterium fortuitum]|uniref:Helix-turn-helix domain-containing protein n=2 Tax=Mycolicibacterium fortuitum TaxID=1766 RepID=A0AAE5AB02_MYCFO|nr:helix-turn-helix domain-containing protein [Mycolicibacterium fortuitum]MDV7189596.1 helix-turn-helix domain-containing protein [Mycolicibacterium fortuitum]MDV7203107.1 helix-turn-helix domain-containing protein [Mycolicibacterium fortuitum]MDV7224677.1 helix-turn-helix domain-containing protein [Mycolicibacterium fortuitum]MDV7256799.1 helix-turn-helix domain-containing protein [Mycolicibacterium fortuitum]MDV7281684.1 helix-turn-helix domain-containing protein [Mycolicibacterium fortuitu
MTTDDNPEDAARELRVDEAARELRVHPQTIRRRIHDGSLPAVRVAGRFLIRRADLELLRVAVR